jgi:hypothetical protein
MYIQIQKTSDEPTADRTTEYTRGSCRRLAANGNRILVMCGSRCRVCDLSPLWTTDITCVYILIVAVRLDKSLSLFLG